MFQAALAHYSQSVLQAPLKSKEAALGLGNRSAVFFELREWTKCLDDINAAMSFFDYPNEMQYKLLDRKGRCLKQLERELEAQEAFEKAIKAVDVSKLKKEKMRSLKDEIKEEIKSLPGTNNAIKPMESSGRSWQCPFKILEPNKSFPVLADSLNIAYGDDVGRHVVATRNIAAGEVLNIEDAIACHLSPFKMKTNCVHCFRKTSATVLPSPINGLEDIKVIETLSRMRIYFLGGRDSVGSNA